MERLAGTVVTAAGIGTAGPCLTRHHGGMTRDEKINSITARMRPCYAPTMEGVMQAQADLWALYTMDDVQLEEAFQRHGCPPCDFSA